MSTLFERLDSAATELGKKLQAGVETVRLQTELMKLQHKRRGALEDLGRFAHTEARQGSQDAARRDALLTAIDDLDAQVAKLERELTAAKGEVVSVHEKPDAASE
jgi:phage I-like protein